MSLTDNIVQNRIAAALEGILKILKETAGIGEEPPRYGASDIIARVAEALDYNDPYRDSRYWKSIDYAVCRQIEEHLEGFECYKKKPKSAIDRRAVVSLVLDAIRKTAGIGGE